MSRDPTGHPERSPFVSSELQDPGPAPDDLERIRARVMLDQVRARMFGRGDPLRVGRFALTRRLGHGAQGTVYLAHDSELRRPVAVKLFEATASDAPARARLLREAQTLAQLQHPNVLAIYDVGLEGERAFIAMEYAEGGTLRQWCRNHPPGSRQRFEALLALALPLARGLAAAHDAGIIHRDIKPANVFLGADQRPRLADFGVARETHDAAASTTMSGAGQTSAADDVLTRTRGIVGTPGYMSPEQFDGIATPSSDQWGLCATLWEAAYGVRAYQGTTIAALAEAVRQAPPRPPPQRREVPSWWAEILARGLDPDPARRWPSVAAMVAELESIQGRRRRRRVIFVAGAGLVVAATVGLGVQLDRRRREAACAQQVASMDTTWNPEVAGRLRDALVASQLPYASASSEHAAAYFDAYAQTWRSSYAQLCVATEVESRRPVAAWEASRECLQRGRGDMQALLDLLTDAPGPSMIRGAVVAASRLGGLERCTDERWLARQTTHDDPASADLRGRLQEARALFATGAYPSGFAIARVVAEDVDGVDDVRLRLSARVLAGQLAAADGKPAEAETWLTRAFDEALGAAEDELALEAATRLLNLYAADLGDAPEATRWARIAQGFHTRLGARDGLEAADLQSSLGQLYELQAEYAASETARERALQIRTRILGDEHPDVAGAWNSLATSYLRQARFPEAERAYGRALAVQRQAGGEGHPEVASSHNNLGIVYRRQGRIEDAKREHETALSLREVALGPTHPETATSYANLGLVLRDLGELDRARESTAHAIEILQGIYGPDHFELADRYNDLGIIEQSRGQLGPARDAFARALEIFERTVGPDHPSVAGELVNLATVDWAQRDFEAAERSLRRALPIVEAKMGRSHPNYGGMQNNLGNVLLGLHRYPEAEQAFVEAAQIWSAAFGDDHVSVAEPLMGVARTRLVLDPMPDPVAPASRALAILEASEASASDLAEARFVLARSLYATGGDEGRARRLAGEALDALEPQDPAQEATRAEIRAWLDARDAAGGTGRPG